MSETGEKPADVREAIAWTANRERTWRKALAHENGGKDPLSKDGKVPPLEKLQEQARKDYLRHDDK